MGLLIKAFLASFLFFLSLTSAWAESMQCIGMDGSGQTLRVIVDVPSGTVNINGHILEIASGSKDGRTLTTKNYVSDEGILAKAILTHTPGKTDVTLLQVNSATKELIARAPLACHKE